jgi:dCTP deaminase
VYGPSQPRMLGLLGCRPESLDGKTFEPLVAHGLEANSIGFLIEEERPVIWRGPMVTQALQQLAFQTNWHDLDYLIVDLPPGTGDIQLTLTQKVPLAGAIIVTTPQDIALADARKGLKMFEKVGVPVLGVIENMSTFICPCCQAETAIFGAGGGEQLAAESTVPLLGRLPLHAQIREEADGGRPTVIAAPDSPLGQRYLAIGRRVAEGPARNIRPDQCRARRGGREVSIRPDRWIRRMAEQHGMIEPFEPGQVRSLDGRRVISFGTSSYGYDVRCARQFKVFTNINSTIVDPKAFDPNSFVDMDTDVCIIPPNSFALASTVEYFRIPRNVLTVCLGKSTYARCGIIVNVTPLEPEWEGHVTLEFSNTTPLPARIYANEGVAQMLFFESDEICAMSYKDRGGKYQGQRGVTLPRA